MRTVLVLGASGFIGRHFCRFARQFAASEGVRTNIVEDSAGLSTDEAANLDFSPPTKLENLVAATNPDYIVNLIGAAGDDAVTLERINAEIPRRLMTLLADTHSLRGVRLLLLGSASEYGDNGCTVQAETAPVQPTSAYGRSKVRQFEHFRELTKLGVAANLARPFNIVGPGMPTHLSLPTFAGRIKHAHAGGTIVTGNLAAIRDYLDVNDVVAGLWAVLTSDASGEVYNVCSGVGRSMRSILETMIAISGKALVISEDTQASPGVLVSIGSTEKLERTSGWRPQVPLETSLRSLLETA